MPIPWLKRAEDRVTFSESRKFLHGWTSREGPICIEVFKEIADIASKDGNQQFSF
jgi:hypothetical protein